MSVLQSATFASAPPRAPGQLSRRQALVMMAYGLIFWLLAALFIRWAPWNLFDRGAGSATLFLFTIALAWPSVWIARRAARLTPDQIVPACVLASVAAMLCDGVGLVWWSVYGQGDRLPGAAWLLWGVGLILGAALIEARRV